MSWNPLTANDVQGEMLPDESALLLQIESGNTLPAIVVNVVLQIRGAIQAGNYDLGADGTIPDQLRSDAIAIARWRWFSTMPKTDLQSEAREKQYKDAIARLERVANQDEAIEPPTAGSALRSGSWNSENKLILRTHPIPPPSTQFQSTSSTQAPYANPNGPADN